MTRTPADHGADAARRDAASPARRSELEAKDAAANLAANDAKYGFIRRLGFFTGPDLGHGGHIVWNSPLTIVTFNGDDWTARSKSNNMVTGRGTGRDELIDALGYKILDQDRPGGTTHSRR